MLVIRARLPSEIGAVFVKPLPELELEIEGWEGKPKWGYAPIDLALVLETVWRPSVGEDEDEPPET
jgi:hypothetical protein